MSPKLIFRVGLTAIDSILMGIMLLLFCGKLYESNKVNGDEYEVEHDEAEVGVVLNSSKSTDDDEELFEHFVCSNEVSLSIGFELELKSIDNSVVMFSR